MIPKLNPPAGASPVSRTSRRSLFALCLQASAAVALGGECLPQSVAFKNAARFQEIVATALKENWRALPMGERVASFGKAMLGTPYKGFTLEIDDHIESPSCNFSELDCWTFFETALGLARMIEVPKSNYTPSDLLAEIEWTRYRAGVCTGKYLERLHYLDEWYNDNAARGNILNITKSLGQTELITGRKQLEMTNLWKSYRYLRCNPELRAPMRLIEERLEQIPFSYIPKDDVKAVESKIQSGDIIGIVTNQQGGFCSHVGLAFKTEDGVCHFMHASSNYRKVVRDKAISAYLHDFRYDAGIIVGRPQPRAAMVTSAGEYRNRLAVVTGRLE